MSNSILKQSFSNFNEPQIIETIVELENILEHLYRTLYRMKPAH